MGYFREIPDIEYQSPFNSRISDSSYVLAKNIFKKMKIRDDLQDVFTIFNKYVIREGQRPDTLAEALYGKSDLDWIILISAGIINVRDEWPMSDHELYEYVVNKYTTNRLESTELEIQQAISAVHHYETTEVKDDQGRLILPKGKIVDSDFSIPNPSNKTLNLNPVTTVTNYEYEIIVNEAKREIFLLKPSYLQQFLLDFRQQMVYTKSSEFVNSRLIRTENTRIK
tara:strand:+ start:1576 stop:2253 length:678 start_codon:yes stop_codon:yes gene_type:complete